MMEYEYSFKVKDLKPFFEYCKKNKYRKIKEVKQIRDLYTNNSGIEARVTISKESIIIDFKEEDNTNNILKNTKESLPLNLNKKNIKNFYSILDILGYYKMKHLIRTRTVYKKGKVKFEIDKYTQPEKMNVVAIEGQKEEVDKVYKEIKELIK